MLAPRTPILLAWLGASVLVPGVWALDPVIDVPMYRDPDLPHPPVVEVFPEKAKALWLRALARPEVDLRCQAAAAFAEAGRRGVKGLEDAIGPLRAALDREGQHPPVRLAIAHALIALEARQTAPSLLQQARSGSAELRALVEPALARWDYRPARALWLERLRDPATPTRSLVLAVRGLATVREAKAAERLRDLTLGRRTSGPLRLEAARALGQVRTEGLEKDAERLAADASPRGLLGRLAAAALLRQHRSEEAIRLLQRLARDPEPAVAAVAAGRLVGLDPKLGLPVLDALLTSSGAEVRSFGVEVLFRQPTKEHVRRLAERLADTHPDVRVKARRALGELAARKELHDLIIAEGVAKLAGKEWRAQEQAAILLVQLNHKAASARLLELLKAERPEVFVTAAWGLRKLAVPKTLDGVLSYVEAEAEKILSGRLPEREKTHFEEVDHQLSQLNQFLGRQKFDQQQLKRADRVLRWFLPRGMGVSLGPEARAAAVWTLGLINKGKKDAALVKTLEERLNATTTIPPEYSQVRWMAAVTLARMQGKEALNSLRRHSPQRGPSLDPVNNACAWAVAKLAGEAVPPPEPIRRMQRNWFLVPDE